MRPRGCQTEDNKGAMKKKGPLVVVERFFLGSGMKSYPVIWGLFHKP